jgi:hypothetical protein
MILRVLKNSCIYISVLTVTYFRKWGSEVKLTTSFSDPEKEITENSYSCNAKDISREF